MRDANSLLLPPHASIALRRPESCFSANELGSDMDETKATLEAQSQAVLSLQDKGVLYPIEMELKDRLKAARKRANKTQAEAARELGVTPQAVSQWERGESLPEAGRFISIGNFYETDPVWLLGGDDGQIPAPLQQQLEEAARPAGPSIVYRPPPRDPSGELREQAESQGDRLPLPQFFGERDLKVFAAVEGGPGVMVVSTDPIETVPRPWYMKDVRDGYAVLVVGESMVPAFKPGDMAIVNPRLPALRGQDVILIGGEHEGEFRASIKHLEGSDAKVWRLRQYNPPRGEKGELAWPKKDWPKALRVVGKYYGG